VRHPLQLVLPADAALAEAAVHRDLFGLRRPAVVKGCKCHAELFHDTAARDIAGILDAWMHRFEPDAFIAKRYEQAAKEMTQLMSTSAQPSADSESTGASEQRKKKEKKKK
ncbi:hypothetical protein DQ04_07751020, partial [Trypanosoma grayi]|uniref:hypothetical protein n=1 Tax=Trypanosoma grayi TaxID=71804 RepID=UPI0004F47A6E